MLKKKIPFSEEIYILYLHVFIKHEINLLRHSLPSGQYKMAQTTQFCIKVLSKKTFKVLNMRNLRELSNS